MTVPNPDALWFQYFGGAGTSEISLEREIDAFDWSIMTRSDIYSWSYANRRTFYNVGNAAAPISTQATSPVIIATGFFQLAEGRKDILVHWDLENIEVTVRLFDNLNTNFATTTITQSTRAQGTYTFSAVASAATDGYLTIEAKQTIIFTNGNIFGMKIIEQRVAQGDL